MAEEPPPAITFATKEEFTTEVEKHVNKALAPKLEQNKKLTTELEALRPLADKVADLEQKLDGKQQTADEQLQTEVTQLKGMIETLQGKVGEAEQLAVTKEQAWHQSEASKYLQALALEAGAAPTAVGDIPAVFPRDQITVTVDEKTEQPVARLVDPEMAGMAHRDQLAAMKAYLQTKPHLLDSPPNGAGQAGGGASDKPKDWDSMTSDEQLKEALNEQGVL